MSTSEIAATLTALANGEPVNAIDRVAVKLYLNHLDAQEGQPRGENLREQEQPTTVKLRDGRVVDVFPSGGVQVYTADLRHGVEIRLPLATTDGGTIPIHKLG